jgi:hypothetical protein
MGEGTHAMTDLTDEARGQDHEDVTDTDADPAIDAATEPIVESIDATREEMTDTIEAIGDRLDPSRIAADAKQTVRDATVGKVETMTQQMTDVAGDAGATIVSTGSGLIDTIRRNPLPAAMAAVGIGWLLTRGGDRRSDARSLAAWEADTGRWTGTGSTRSANGNGEGLGEKVGSAADQASRQARTAGSDLVGAIEREPLVAGAVAVAIGAAAAMLLPPTDIERNVVGPTGQKVLSAVEDVAGQRMEAMRAADTTTASV